MELSKWVNKYCVRPAGFYSKCRALRERGDGLRGEQIDKRSLNRWRLIADPLDTDGGI